jgi:DNA-binding transcriptional MocR family regulator
MRSVNRERLEALEAAAVEFCGGALRLRPIQGGLHAVADLDDVDDERVCTEARGRGIEAAPLRSYYAGRPAARGLLLGFASTAPATLRRGMEQLAAAIEAARRLRRAPVARAAAGRV